MLQYIRKIGVILKAGFICAVLSFVILFYILQFPIEAETQYFDLKTAAIISIGLGTSFRMFHYKRNEL